MATIGNLVVALTASTEGFAAGMKDSQTIMEAVEKKAIGTHDALKSMGIAAGIGFAAIAAEAKKAVSTYQEYGEQVDKMVKASGASAEAIQKLGYAAQQEHGSMEALGVGMARLSRAMVEAADGSKTAGEAFGKIGLSVTDASGGLKGADEMLLEVAEKFRAMEDPVTKSALAMELFGRGGYELVPFLSQGREEIERLGKEAAEAGLVLSGDAVKAAEALGDQMSLMSKSVQGAQMALGEALTPVVSQLIGSVTPVVQGLTDWIRANPELASTLIKVGAAATGVVAAIAGIGLAIGPLTSGLAALTSPVGLAVVGIGAAIAGGIAIYENWDKIAAFLEGVWRKILGVAGEVWGAIKGVLSAAWQAIVDVFYNATPLGFIVKNWDEIAAATRRAWDGIKAWLFDTCLAIKTKFTGTFTSIADFFEGIWSGVAETFTGAWEGMATGIKGFVNSIIHAINIMIQGMNKLSFNIPEWVPVIGGKTWGLNIPLIPTLALAHGAVLPGYGGGDQIPALLEAGEAVIPKEVVRRRSDLVAGLVKGYQKGGFVWPAEFPSLEDWPDFWTPGQSHPVQSMLSYIAGLRDSVVQAVIAEVQTGLQSMDVRDMIGGLLTRRTPAEILLAGARDPYLQSLADLDYFARWIKDIGERAFSNESLGSIFEEVVANEADIYRLMTKPIREWREDMAGKWPDIDAASRNAFSVIEGNWKDMSMPEFGEEMLQWFWTLDRLAFSSESARESIALYLASALKHGLFTDPTDIIDAAYLSRIAPGATAAFVPATAKEVYKSATAAPSVVAHEVMHRSQYEWLGKDLMDWLTWYDSLNLRLSGLSEYELYRARFEEKEAWLVQDFVKFLLSRFPTMERILDLLGTDVREQIEQAALLEFKGRYASGAILPGFGGGDRIPALLEAGEAVVPAKVVRGGIADIVSWFRESGVARYQEGITPAVAVPTVLAASQSTAELRGQATFLSRLTAELIKTAKATELLRTLLQSLASELQQAGNAWAGLVGLAVEGFADAFAATGDFVASLAASIKQLASVGLQYLGRAIIDLFTIPAKLKEQYPYGAYGEVNYPDLARMRENYEDWNANFQKLQEAYKSQATLTVGGGLLGGGLGFLIGSLFGGPVLGALLGAGLGALGGYAVGQATYGQQIEDLKKKLEDTFQKIAETLGTAMSNVGQALGAAFSADTYTGFVRGLAVNVETMVKDALIKAFLAGEIMRPLLQQMSDYITAAVWDGILTAQEMLGLESLFQQIVATATPFWEALTQFDFAEALGLATDAVNNFTESLRSVPAGFKAAWVRWESTAPVAMQHGGIVTHPTLGWLGERGPEAVIPLRSSWHEEVNYGSSDAGDTRPVEFHLHVNGDIIGIDNLRDFIVETLDAHRRRTRLTQHGIARGAAY